MAKSIAIQGEKIGPMFITCKQGYTFAGWYTELEGGELVTEDSIYDFDRDITLYAHYLEN